MRTIAITLLVLAGGCGAREFDSLGTFARAQDEAGFVILGTFGTIQWPATVVEEREQKNEISFKTPDGTPHRYPGYDGFTLKVLRLKGRDGAEIVFVLRSK